MQLIECPTREGIFSRNATSIASHSLRVRIFFFSMCLLDERQEIGPPFQGIEDIKNWKLGKRTICACLKWAALWMIAYLVQPFNLHKLSDFLASHSTSVLRLGVYVLSSNFLFLFKICCSFVAAQQSQNFNLLFHQVVAPANSTRPAALRYWFFVLH